MPFKLRLFDTGHHDMESVWAEATDTPNKARLLNTPVMFPALAVGSVVDHEWDEHHSIHVSFRNDGLSGAARTHMIDAVWNNKEITKQ